LGVDSVGEELERLARLRASGDLTDAEYELLKTKLIQDGEITALDQEAEVDGQKDASEEFLRRVVFNSSTDYLECVQSHSMDGSWCLARSPYLDDAALPQWKFERQFPDYSSRPYRPGPDTKTRETLKGWAYGGVPRPLKLDKASLSEVDLSGAWLDEVRMNKADLSRSNLRGASLRGASCRGSNFQNADLSFAQFELSHLDRRRCAPDFTGSNLSGACLVGCQGTPKFNGADLFGANFQEADLTIAEFKRSNAGGTSFARSIVSVCMFWDTLCGPVDFMDAFINASVFLRANLAGSRFTRACLTQSQFSSCTVDQAVFTGADLSMADFSGMERESLEGADLRGALADSETKWPKGFDPAKAGVRFS